MKKQEAANNYDDPQYQKYVDVLNDGYVDRKKPAAISHLIPTMSRPVYGAFQGDNEFVITGKLKEWQFESHLKEIKVPTLLTFGEHETMPIATAKRMATEIPHARLVTTPEGGHHHMIDNAVITIIWQLSSATLKITTLTTNQRFPNSKRENEFETFLFTPFLINHNFSAVSDIIVKPLSIRHC